MSAPLRLARRYR